MDSKTTNDKIYYFYFMLDEEDSEVLEYEADDNTKARILNDIVYRGDIEDGR